jgi:hypothetical protein
MKRICIILSLVFTILGLGTSAPAAAITNTDKFHVYNDTPFYDPNDELTCSSASDEANTPSDDAGSSCPLMGSSNIEKAFNYFHICKKLSSVQAAGILGNLIQESGVNPKAPNPAASGGGGGIAQWEGGRWDNLQAYAKKMGKPWTDLHLQLDFLWKEMPSQHPGPDQVKDFDKVPGISRSTNAVEAMKLAKTTKQAAWAWELTMERASDPRMDNRIKYANQTLQKYGTGDAANPGSVAADPNNDIVCATDDGTVTGPGGTSALVTKAISLAWPKPACQQTYNGEQRSGCKDPLAAYKSANVNKGGDDPYTDCGTFVATSMRKSGSDPKYPPVGTAVQRSYVLDHPEKFEVITNPNGKIGDANDTDKRSVHPGDVMIYNDGSGSGHTLIYGGGGVYPTISASWHDHSPHRSGIGSVRDMFGKPNLVIARLKQP